MMVIPLTARKTAPTPAASASAAAAAASAEPLAEAFGALCGALGGLRRHVEGLTTVHAAVDAFNGAFGRFQSAMALHASCLAFPAPAPVKMPPPPPTRARPTGIPKPQIVTKGSTLANDQTDPPPLSMPALPPPPPPSEPRAKAPAATKKRPGGRPGGKRPVKGRRPPAAAAVVDKRPPRPDTAPWKWDKNLRDQIPRKYQSDAELAKLENILLYLKNRQSGITIADLVKHSGLAVIRCKEVLQTLTKLQLISRRQEPSGFIYTFGHRD